MRGRFIKALLFFSALISLSVNATQESEKLDLESYVAKTLQQDTNYLSSKIDVDITNIKYESGNSLYRGIFSASPFSRNYKVLETNSYSSSSFEENGLKLGYTQFLPTGTQLNFTVDQYSENTRTSTFAKKNGYSLGLIQPILKNYFGISDQLNADYFSAAIQATTQKSQIVKNEACAKAVGHFVNAWVSSEKKKFSDEMLTLANELYKKSEKSKKNGQIGHLDWLGVQSEYLNQKNLSEQHLQTVTEAMMNLKEHVPSLNTPKLIDPSSIFKKLAKSIDINSLPDTNLQLEQMNSSIKALDYKLKSEENSTLPDLDLKIEKINGSGSVATEKYKEDDLTLGLNFIWKLNDDSVSAQSKVSKLELQKIRYQYNEMLRNRKINIETKYKDILSKEQQIDFEKGRSLILSKITDENKKRFLQGRIEFQDFLRIKEQLFVNQNNYLDRQAQMWKNLIDFALTENVAVPFCEEAK